MENSSPITLSIVIPAYNESLRIIPTLEKVDFFLTSQNYRCEVLVVNDCSKDDTAALVQKFIQNKPAFHLINQPHNMGKGAAVKTGMLQAQGKFRLFSDADLSTPIEEVNKFLLCVEYDVVIGSRRMKGSYLGKKQPFLRELSGKIFSLIVRLVALSGFLDTQCGFKLFTEEAAKNVFSKQTIPGFGFDVELLYIAVKRFKYKVKEHPVQWFDSPNTKVQLFRDSTRMFFDLLVIRWNHLTGKYS